MTKTCGTRCADSNEPKGTGERKVDPVGFADLETDKEEKEPGSLPERRTAIIILEVMEP
jgi:hypothetical protein